METNIPETDYSIFKGIPLVPSHFPPKYCERVYNFSTGTDDVFIVSYPRTGTTWTSNIMLGLRYGDEKLINEGKLLNSTKVPFLEYGFPNDDGSTTLDAANALENPRFLKTHLRLNGAPKEIQGFKRKCVILLRNPKDTAISYYHMQLHCSMFKSVKCEQLYDFLKQFLVGNVNYGSWWEWTHDWLNYAKQNPDTTLILHYDDLQDNFVESVKKLGNFIGFPATKDEIIKLEACCSIGETKQRMTNSFKVREGAKHGWKNTMTPEMAEKFDRKTKSYFEADYALKLI